MRGQQSKAEQSRACTESCGSYRLRLLLQARESRDGERMSAREAHGIVQTQAQADNTGVGVGAGACSAAALVRCGSSSSSDEIAHRVGA